MDYPSSVATITPVSTAASSQLLMIHVDDHREVLTYEAIQAMELLNEPAQAATDQECCVLSTHAVSGMEMPRMTRLCALVGNQVMLLLVDSGSTHNFISPALAERITARTVPLQVVEVRVAEGERRIGDKLIPGVKWWLQGHSFTTDIC